MMIQYDTMSRHIYPCVYPSEFHRNSHRSLHLYSSIYSIYQPLYLSVYPDLFIYHCLSIFLSIKPSQALTRNNNFKQKQPVFSNVNIQIIPKLIVQRATGRYPFFNIIIGNPRYSAFNFFLRTSGSAMPAFMKPMDLAVAL